ncbi:MULTISPECIES: sulfurtransferase [unclassified Tenacibaculum]|uniref:sulfurtransferase n=1 Tax=unclassified Tenacibaculum TaxID=2635139 RepID=UPI001F2DDCA9|nr:MULTISPECIES: sulfurtransferase [unclassified Tenacibaculum]MCF2873911.1 sulfurtransferase [Tenacibaculum sp. Cn5-1]MCF2936721.1 sulfurtransferase [Tenacibaculum sp. Cn5-34]MCG7512945.1 sulfurtransferase [Tenacibaculum sp. Cn5-46]
MKLNVNEAIVTVEWLYQNLKAENLIILDATITKVGTAGNKEQVKQQVPNAVFFDLKNVFLDKNGEFPNTIPSEKYFQEEAQKLGINKDSCIVVYDDLGVYSAPRVWWLFKTFGFDNIAVLNGGLPNWLKHDYPVEIPKFKEIVKGDFTANYKREKVGFVKDVLEASNKEELILDARSNGRFHATVAEPRTDLRGGHIPNSKSLPYTELQREGIMKSKEELQEIFQKLNPKNEEAIFSCGSGITACILALGSEISGNKNYKVYDGSWTEWASKIELPIEK